MCLHLRNAKEVILTETHACAAWQALKFKPSWARGFISNYVAIFHYFKLLEQSILQAYATYLIHPYFLKKLILTLILDFFKYTLNNINNQHFLLTCAILYSHQNWSS